MTNASTIDRFTDLAKDYDERNRRLSPISDYMHFPIRLILKEFPARSRALCVGVGTRAEILALSLVFRECPRPTKDATRTDLRAADCLLRNRYNRRHSKRRIDLTESRIRAIKTSDGQAQGTPKPWQQAKQKLMSRRSIPKYYVFENTLSTKIHSILESIHS